MRSSSGSPALCLAVLSAVWLGCSTTALGSKSRSDRAEAALRTPRLQPTETTPKEPHEASYSELLVEADRLRDSGNVSKAVWTYLRALRVDPTRTAPRERIGFMHLSEADAERAEAAFESVIMGNPDSGVAYTGRGLAQLHQGKLGAARKSLELGLEREPNMLEGLLAMGLLNDWTQHYADARYYYDLARQVAPGSREVENNVGVSYLLEGNPVEAEEHFRRAIQLDPSDPAQYNNLGLALGQQGLYDQALEAFRNAGSESAAQNNLGYMYSINGEYQRAIRHFEQALSAPTPDRLPIIQNLVRAEDALRDGRSSTGLSTTTTSNPEYSATAR